MVWANTQMQRAANVLGGASATSQTQYLQSHTAAPGGAGTSNVGAGARKAITWASATSDGDFDISANIDFTGMAANEAVYGWTIWDALTSGNLLATIVRSGGDTTANAAGEYTVTSLASNGSTT